MFLMWLGEQITERGIGNGISMLILAGIVATFPQVVTQSINSVQQGQMNMIALLIFSLLALAVVAGIVFIERAQRRIPVNYAQKQSQERKIYAQQQSHLPLKINMAGVIPAIFASSLLLFPASLGQWVGQSPNPNIFQSFLQNMALVLSPGQPLYLVIFAALIIFFCYFYTALVFSPKEVSENLKRSGAYIQVFVRFTNSTLFRSCIKSLNLYWCDLYDNYLFDADDIAICVWYSVSFRRYLSTD